MDRDLLLQQRSRSCRGEAAWAGFALRAQEAIGGGGAHREQLAPDLLGELQTPMPLQRVDQGGQQWDQAFGANAIGDISGQEQRVLDVWPILARTRVRRRVQHLLVMVEQPHP